MDPNTVLFAVAGGLAAVLFAVVLIFLVLRMPPGNARMREIAAAIQEGASAYLNRQYTVIAIIGVSSRWSSGSPSTGRPPALYVVGAVLSASAGYVGMNIAVRSNLRTAEAARGGLNQALQVAFRGGAVTGFMVVGLGTARRFRALTSSSRTRTPWSASPSAPASCRCSPDWAVASTRRRQTSAPTSSARSRRASPRTIPATRR